MIARPARRPTGGGHWGRVVDGGVPIKCVPSVRPSGALLRGPPCAASDRVEFLFLLPDRMRASGSSDSLEAPERRQQTAHTNDTRTTTPDNNTLT